MHVEADDILLTPAFTSPGVCIFGPVLNALSKTDIDIARLEREINFLVTKGKTRQHVMITTDNDTNGTVRTVVSHDRRVVLVFVPLETELVKPLE